MHASNTPAMLQASFSRNNYTRCVFVWESETSTDTLFISCTHTHTRAREHII